MKLFRGFLQVLADCLWGAAEPTQKLAFESVWRVLGYLKGYSHTACMAV
jgi:hypothetical protein